MDETVGYIGRYQQGQELRLVIRCTTTNNVPNTPLLYPVAKIYRGGTLVESVELAADSQGEETGVFRRSLQLGSLYSTTGRYEVVYTYPTSAGAGRVRVGSFTLLPGGSPDGTVVAIHYARRPNAAYLIRQTDAGLLIRGKNPR